MVHADYQQNRLTNREEINTMNTQMGSALHTEKLDRTNFASWEYKMHQYLVGQGYWSYIRGAHETQPNPTHADYPAWEQVASRVLYCLASCVHEHMRGYIRDSKTPKKLGKNSRRFLRPRQLHESSNFDKSYTCNRKTCQSQAIP